MRKYTKLSVQWFYDLLEEGEGDIMDFKEQLEDKNIFGKSLNNFAPKYDETARDVVAFANKKGGFLFIGIADKTKEVNCDFRYENEKIFDLIKQVQDRTQPTITLIPHPIMIKSTRLLVLEVPFSQQIHCTTKGEYLIRNNNGNKPIEPHELATIMADKGLIVYDQKDWDVPDWADTNRIRLLYDKIRTARPDSPLIKKDVEDFCDSLNFIKEVQGKFLPTTTGILLAGNDKSLKQLPYSEIKYVRYFEDGSYQPYEWRGNLIEIADSCFAQLKSEIRQKEFSFGLFHEFVDDYSEVVLRELLINAIVHRDYSRQQVIEIRKYPTYLEIESPGLFPDGVDESNYLHKTNSRNPNIMDVFRSIKYAEKAGSGFDKIFTELLSKGKRPPVPKQTNTSLIFTVESSVYSDKLMELALIYKQQMGKDMDVDALLVLNEIIERKKASLADIESVPNISQRQIKRVLDELTDMEFIEETGRTSGLKYILHKSKRSTIAEKINYSQQKIQERARQKEAILRYLDDIGTIDNEAARLLLKLPDKKASAVSRLFRELREADEIEILDKRSGQHYVYQRKKK